MSNKIEKTIEWCIYQSRWLQVPVYIGMCVVMGMYSYVFCGLMVKCTPERGHNALFFIPLQVFIML